MKRLTLAYIFAVLTSFAVSAQTLEQKSHEVFDNLQYQLVTLKQSGRLNETSVTELVELAILPHIDQKFFAYKALGKNLAKLNSEEKQAFILHLSHRLVKSYVGPLMQFDNETFQNN